MSCHRFSVLILFVTRSVEASDSCNAPPCAASLLGDVGVTIVSGTDPITGYIPKGENIYGPFEAGFSSRQDFILSGLGCNPASRGYVAGGIDTHTAEQMVAFQCGVTLPRDNWQIGLLDECGGHTKDYHFHERLSCLYSKTGTHSPQIGQMSDNQRLYGQWENASEDELPNLDACGGHFGPVPDGSPMIYHYHVQLNAPFTVGCFGPKKESDGSYSLVTLDQCRALYDGCGNTAVNVTTSSGTELYRYWCPCYDKEGSNDGSEQLSVFTISGAVTTCTGTDCTTFSMASTSSGSRPAPAWHLLTIGFLSAVAIGSSTRQAD